MGHIDTDLELVKKVQSGDNRAFDLLVIKYQSRVKNLISRLIKQPAVVEEVAQEVFFKAYRFIPNFRGDSNFYTWLYRIAVNTAKTWLKQQNFQLTSDVIGPEDETFTEDESHIDERTPESELIHEELVAEMNKAIEALPEHLRTAFLLRTRDELSYEDIAEVTQTPIGTVRSRIFRARESIAQHIQHLVDYKIR
ncbi:sigma-70 family RNA polymerase sigma factor [Basilea psittacipulmonis]|uniref:RNA polymerase sigma factor RpoE n=1 Tax=Basilea psittacipulmonis DSM 24701 TaxID=1072685 RepID=A0A077DEJ1_9BURK|nr:sigma-70 family RNA polymerase sigma factor [Basilea psittacipulmonis]AIL33245.1 hypothetical protein IX83_08005 [Basilea psittacipulmonis DSM 24701]